MKKFISPLLLAILAIFILVGCSDNNVVEPQDNENSLDRRHTAIVVPVEGTINSIPFTADLLINRFIKDGDNILAQVSLRNITGDGLPLNVGDLEGLLFNAPVNVSQRSCDILFLELGPLNLDLLGLVVFLDQVTLEITAEQGPGNLLGNLLCAITSILDGGNPLSDIVGLLNRIVRLIGV
jgi:hypothetical protein